MTQATNTNAYKVVVAYDFSELAERALERGLTICEGHPHAELHVLTVGFEQGTALCLPSDAGMFEPAEAQENVRAHVAKLVDDFTSKVKISSLERIAVYAVAGQPSERIVALADALDANLIVLGTHSRSGIARLMLGSVAEAVVRRAPCSVLVIRPTDFVSGRKVPAIEPPLTAGETGVPHFVHPPVYHYVSRAGVPAARSMPVS